MENVSPVKKKSKGGAAKNQLPFLQIKSVAKWNKTESSGLQRLL